jgi:hypothetical protein
MKIPATTRLASALTVLAAVGCGPSITSERDESIPIPAGATVAFAGAASEGEKHLDPAVSNDIMHRRIQAALKKELAAHGFTAAADPAKADFVIRYFVGVQQHTDYVTTTTGVGYGPGWGGYGGWGYGYGWGWGYGGYGGGVATTTTQPVTVQDASFVVDLVDHKTGNTAWRGVWQGDPPKQAPSQERIDAGMAKVFKTFPVVGK